MCGNVNYAKGRFFASEHAIVTYPLKKQNVIWLGESIRLADFNRLSQSAAQPGISVQVVKNVQFAEPPKKEQELLGKYIQKVDKKITKSINSTADEIEKLTEYKAILIDSAVTGKIKVS